MCYCMKPNHVVTLVRILVVVCLVFVAALTAVASGYCVSNTITGSQTTTYCVTSETPFSINHWNDGTTYTELKGQYFVFVAALVFLLASFGLVFLSCANHPTNKHIIMIVCGLGVLVMLVAGILEGWYASGFGKATQGVSFYIRSWVAASVFCFGAVLLYTIDICLALKPAP